MEPMVNFILGFTGPWAYILVFGILLLCGFGLPIPEDVTLFAGGYIAYKGTADVYLMILIAFAGVMVGDSIIFMLGQKYGKRAAQKGPLKKVLTPARLATVEQGFRKRGNTVIFFARFMPGLRAPIFFTAGTMGVPFKVFFAYDGIAALISVPAIVYSVFHFGAKVDYIIDIIQKVEYGILAFIFCMILVFSMKWYLGKRKLTRQAGAVRANEGS
jgi:membrane protein DedA with SNARE-associated domain